MKNLFATLSLLLAVMGVYAQTGTIRGTAIEGSTGEPLMFANVTVPGTTPLVGGQTDLDGVYELTVAAGTWNVEISYVGYDTKTITGVVVKEGEVTVLDISLEESAEQLQEVVVQAARIDRTENAVLALRRSAFTVQDNISSQEISRFGASNAAESMKRVTGASVVGGKYIFVRGLGDRYTSAQLNGLQLPSTDPYRNTVQLDLVPANLLDNIIAEKTFTPDQPGSFTGGNVNLNTKSFPEDFTLQASISANYNTQSSFRNDFLTHEGGSTDWLGYDDGSRDIPAILQSDNYLSTVTTSTAILARRNADLANLLEEGADALSGQRTPNRKMSALDHGVSLSLGNQYRLGESNDRIGLTFGMNYSRSFDQYDNGRDAYFELTDPNADLNVFRDLRDERGVETAQLGGMASLGYKFGGTNKITLLAVYNNIGTSDNRLLEGSFPAIISGNGTFQTRALRWQERELRNYQLTGEHVLGNADSGVELEWAAGMVDFSQNDPNFRQFSNTYQPGNGTAEDTSYFISPAEFDLPFHFFRSLEDRQYNGKMDLTIPFAQTRSKANKIKVGGFYSTKDRFFRDNVYQVQLGNSEDYQGDADAFFGDDNSGIIGYDENRDRYTIGLYTLPFEKPTRENSYNGQEVIGAGYAMFVYDWPRLKVIAGARAEYTDINVQSLDTTLAGGSIEQTDLLPSFNLIYKLNEAQNLRFSATQTLSRPNMRELAPFISFDYGGDFRIQGNPDLQRTLIQNLDLRYEIFPNAGELFAVSAYFKNFDNPIVTAFVPTSANPLIRYTNVDNAKVYGLEVELRKSLGFLGAAFENFRFSTNVSLIESVVDIPDAEQPIIDQFNPEKGNTRTFQGQSPFLVNAGLNYVNLESGIDAMVSFNMFGRRLAVISEGGDPDVFEESVPTLDFSVSKRLTDQWSLRFRATNLLNPAIERTMNFRDKEYILQSFRTGRNFGLSLTYSL